MQSILIWYILVGLVVAGLGLLVLTNKIFYAFLGFMVVLMALAGIYLLAGSEFIAAGQLLVYVGGVLVLLAFGLMLSDRGKDQEPLNELRSKVWSILSFLGLFSILLILIRHFMSSTRLVLQPKHPNQAKEIGIGLLTTHLIPLELAGFILLVALVAALITIKTKKV